MSKSTRFVAFAVLALAPLAVAKDPVLPREFEGVRVDEKLGQQIDLDLTFVGTDGYPHRLGDYFGKGKPVLVNLVYYSCPMLCNLVLNGQIKTLREIPWTPGDEFDIVTISIDPTERFHLAQQKRQLLLESYGKPAPGWKFFADHQGNAKKLASQLGFHYRLDERTGQYAHASAIFVLTPEGKVSRYLYGIQYKPRDLRLALAEASESKVGMSFEKLLLMCFHYDPNASSYVMAATNVMRGGGVLVMLGIGWMLWRFWRKERTRGTVDIRPPGVSVSRS